MSRHKKIIESFNASCTDSRTREIFADWLLDPRDQEEKYEALRAVWDDLPIEAASNSSYRKFLKATSRKLKWKNRLMKIAVAAAVILPLATIATTMLLPRQEPEQEPPQSYALVRCTAGFGEVKEMELPDGTLVRLNSGSSLIYAENMATLPMRQVVLEGEASFDVAHDSLRTFIVSADRFNVLALGTIFSVSSFSDATFSSVLLKEGSVKLTFNELKESEILLSPGEQAVLDKLSNTTMVSKFEGNEYGAWEEGTIILRSSDMASIAEIFRRHYGVNIFHTDARRYTQACITARFDASFNLEEALEVLRKLIPGMQYRIEGNTVFMN